MTRFFVSYNKADERWAEWIARALKEKTQALRHLKCVDCPDAHLELSERRDLAL